MSAKLSSVRAKGARSWWPLVGGALVSSCSAPYDADPQFWPNDGLLTNGGGTSPLGSGGTPTAGSAGAASSGAGLGGTVAFPPGGAPGASGSTQALGGANGFGGMNGFGGTATGGAAGASGAAGFGGLGAGGTSFGGNAGAASGGTSSSTNCSLSVKVTTASAGGRYAPRNIGAVWVADQSGNFVRSLEVWAQRRASNLSMWNSTTSKAGVPGSRVDIVSQATLSTHTTHTSTWNCQDFNKKAVPDGMYRVYFEMTDSGSNGPNRFEVFTKGPAAATTHPADNNNFKSIELSFKP